MFKIENILKILCLLCIVIGIALGVYDRLTSPREVFATINWVYSIMFLVASLFFGIASVSASIEKI